MNQPCGLKMLRELEIAILSSLADEAQIARRLKTFLAAVMLCTTMDG